MALGARRWDVLKLILRKGAVLAGGGIVAGVIVSAATASMMASLLYGVQPHDLLVFLACLSFCLRSHCWPGTFQRGARRRWNPCLPFGEARICRVQIEYFAAMKGRLQ
jgi:ABC-type antimicrobial peptide transport system permease subunit